MANSFPLNNGTVLVIAEAPGGLYNAIQLQTIAALCEGELAVVKATEDQRLSLFVKEDELAKVEEELANVGISMRPYQNGLHQATACLGELCPMHEQDALGAAVELAEVLKGIDTTSPLKIGINGCSNCCVPCHTHDIAVLGERTGYRISVAGKNAHIPEMASFMAEGVPPEKLTGLLKQVIEVFQRLASEGESLHEVIERCGASEFIEALSPYSQDAATGSEASDLFGDASFASEEEEVVEQLGGDSVAGLTVDEEVGIAGDLAGDEEVKMHDTEVDTLPDLVVDEPVVEEMADELAAEPGVDFDGAGDIGIDGGDNAELAADVLIHDDSNELVEDTPLSRVPVDDAGGESLVAKLEAPSDLAFAEDMDIAEEMITSEGEEADLPEVEEEMLNEEVEVNSLPNEELDGFVEGEPTSLEDLESRLESELAESIEEEKNLRAEMEADDNTEERLAALHMVEKKATAPSESPIEPAESTHAEVSEFEEEKQEAVAKPASKVNQAFQFSGVTISDNGNLMIHFTSGAFVEVDPSRFQGSYKAVAFGDQVVEITVGDNGFHIEADGMAFFLPLEGNAAA